MLDISNHNDDFNDHDKAMPFLNNVSNNNISNNKIKSINQLHSDLSSQYISNTLSSNLDIYITFMPIRTIPLIILQILYIIFIQIQLFLIWFTPNYKYILFPCILFLIFVFSYPLTRYEHMSLRSYGYLNPLISSNMYLRLPIFISSFGAVGSCLLYIFFINERVYDDSSFFTPTMLLKLLLSIEHVLLIIVLIYYLIGCIKHNYYRTPPDICQREYAIAAQNSIPKNISIDDDDNLDRAALVRKQTKIIIYLQNQVKTLSDELIRVLRVHDADEDDLESMKSNSVAIDIKKRVKNSSADIAQSLSQQNSLQDLEYLLSVKESEVRSMAAEREKQRLDGNMIQDKYVVVRAKYEKCSKDLEASNMKVDELVKEIDSLNKKQQKLTMLLEVEQEANVHAQDALQRIKENNHVRNSSVQINQAHSPFTPILQSISTPSSPRNNDKE